MEIATFLFTDIEGSTALLHRLGPDDYAHVLAGHNRILRSAWAAHAGRQIGTEGDSHFVAFERPGDAVRAAVAAHAGLAAEPWPTDATVRIRVGIHTGEAQPFEESYLGMSVHRAARIAAGGPQRPDHPVGDHTSAAG